MNDYAPDRHGALLRQKATLVARHAADMAGMAARHAAEILVIDAEISVAQRENITNSAATVIISGHQTMEEKLETVVQDLDTEQRAVLAQMRAELHSISEAVHKVDTDLAAIVEAHDARLTAIEARL